MRSRFFVDDGIYHIFNKSIANFNIFKSSQNSKRFIEILDYYNSVKKKPSFSNYLIKNQHYYLENLLYPRQNRIVKFLSYCIMPDHYHLLVKIINNVYIYKFLNNIGNSFTRYFNLKFNRKGPLWQFSYKAKVIINNEQLLHVSRYIHLNPTSAGLVDRPEDWRFSSYRDFIFDKTILEKIINEISIRKPLTYKNFVENNKDYQKKLKTIGKLILE